MSTIDRLLMDARAAQLRGNPLLAAQILDEVERIKQAEARRAKWLAKKEQQAKGGQHEQK